MTRRLIDLPEMIVRDVAQLREPSAINMLRVTPEELDRIVTSRVEEIGPLAAAANNLLAALKIARDYITDERVAHAIVPPDGAVIRTSRDLDGMPSLLEVINTAIAAAEGRPQEASHG